MSRAKRCENGDGSLYGIRFWCPGCKSNKVIPVQQGVNKAGGAQWGWNGDLERPTLTPSVLQRFYRMSEKGKSDMEAWVHQPAEKRAQLPEGFRFDGEDVVCHSFVTDGRIQFLSDCTHELVNSSVDLPDLAAIGQDWD